MTQDDQLAALKALSNETRLNILCWLREPDKQFSPQPADVQATFPGGVCVGSIQEKAGLTQSVISSYLASMQKAGLLESRRCGQWTYYRRNERGIASFLSELAAQMQAKTE
ncbi:ArsR/SmtB family transcription factor [Cohnella hashimotonis]|uniref:Metalloregulator ArsR/SmtB family transcription factor n=1 Tax=Cohnella hashimotonis TaxID=2826895 RepID=A0ABT6TSY4_9BACL|nr:metalloregulator ArsR/SmtB family transcription factor [Cohnella hashimotonis]MDI4649969.1 metalloregulator ArsR/SmtB family transcription factor [Cohnella hashimotonis]